ncbi:MAG: hypothetical protein Q7S65_02610, partial [Nanoarchaeota archaeon]|nr:hypothetical protein [Nanoarchaeota archaeon]
EKAKLQFDLNQGKLDHNTIYTSVHPASRPVNADLTSVIRALETTSMNGGTYQLKFFGNMSKEYNQRIPATVTGVGRLEACLTLSTYDRETLVPVLVDGTAPAADRIAYVVNLVNSVAKLNPSDKVVNDTYTTGLMGEGGEADRAVMAAAYLASSGVNSGVVVCNVGNDMRAFPLIEVDKKTLAENTLTFTNTNASKVYAVLDLATGKPTSAPADFADAKPVVITFK